LAEVAGYAVAKIVWDEDGLNSEQPVIDWGHITKGQLMGKWEETPDDPLLVLIAHSDCEGTIYPEQAGPLADRLEELLPRLPDEEAPGHIGHWGQKTQKFIDGLREAAAEGEPVEFY
jgi:hypothetical protein